MGGKAYLVVCVLALSVFDSQADSSGAIARANTNFGLNLYKKIANASGNENVFFSPFSISSALALFYTGARGQCATQMGDVLGYANDVQSHKGYQELYGKVFQESTANYVLTVANRMFGSDAFEFREQYLKDIKQYYGSELEDIDFTDTEEAREEINDWVAEETNDKIKDLFPEGSIEANTILVLANAIYFKGTWKHMFKKEKTTAGQFTDPSGAQQEVQMMRMTQMFRKGNSDTLNAQILELPYDGENVSFYVILPKSDSTLADTEAALNHESLESAINELPNAHAVDIKVPKFNMTWKMSLIGMLYDMGLKCPFGPGADFSGILEAGGLFASEVVHQAFVVVNEEGTEAAAATGIAATRSRTPQFYVDRPFIFLIRENSTGSILFMGRVMNPGASAAQEVPPMRFARYLRDEITAEIAENPPVGGASPLSRLSLLISALYVLFK